MRTKTLVLNAFLSLALAIPVVASAGETAPDELFKQGNEAFNEGKIDEAITKYKTCVEKRANFKEAWYNLGIAYGRKKQFDQEIDAYKKALEADPKYTKALYNLAIAHEDKGNDDQAIEAYKKVLEAEPKAVDARINLGILYARKGKLERAVEVYMEAIGIDSEVADAHFNLGIAYGKQAAKQTDKALKDELIQKEMAAYQLAVEKNNKYHKAWYNLAIAHNKLGKVEEEIAAYVKAVEVKPEYPQALFNLAFAYEEKKDTANALKYWKQYLKVAEPLPSEKKFVATAKQQVERLEKAGGGDAAPAPAPEKRP